MTFAALAWVDVFDLAASLRLRVGHFPKTGDRRVLMLRGPKKDAEDPDDTATYVRFFAKWPEIKNLTDEVRRASGAPLEFGRIFLEMLMPGGIISWKRDDSEYAQRFQRVHIALRTNPHAFVFIGGAVVNMQPGLINLVEPRLPMSALNLGTTWRCHLVCDFRIDQGDSA